MKIRTDVWKEYAGLFSALTSRYQMEMYELAASRLSGSVIDCGCGAAKLLPYLVARREASAYLGIDASEEMIEQARALLARFPEFDSSVRVQRIEQACGRFDTAVSLQSYYSWDDTSAVLEQIRRVIRPGGTFVLATANDTLDIDSLIDVASRELLMYPGWEEYASINRSLAGGTGKFASLDALIRETQAVGFAVREAHAELFDGGVNFLVLGT